MTDAQILEHFMVFATGSVIYPNMVLSHLGEFTVVLVRVEKLSIYNIDLRFEVRLRGSSIRNIAYYHTSREAAERKMRSNYKKFR